MYVFKEQVGSKMTCKCISCLECNGDGYIWVSFSGEYLGKHRCDDLDEMDVCLDCGGNGTTELCYECQEEYEKQMEEFYR